MADGRRDIDKAICALVVLFALLFLWYFNWDPKKVERDGKITNSGVLMRTILHTVYRSERRTIAYYFIFPEIFNSYYLK